MAPLAVSVVEPPAQIEDEEAVAETTGGELTNTVTLAVALHPFDVPVTV